MSDRVEKPSAGLLRADHPEKIYKTADPRPHLAELDALRGIAILGVMMCHAKEGWDTDSRNPLSLMVAGVDLLDFYMRMSGPFALALFFLLSGYLLTWTEGSRASRRNYTIRSYAFRRALRLVPAYYTALTLIFLMRLTDVLGGKTPTLLDTLAYLGFLQSFVPKPQPSMNFNGSYWYLTSEVVFYAMLPLLILKIRGLHPRLAFFGVLVVVSAILQTFMYLYPSAGGGFTPYYLYGFPLTHLWVFMVGVLLRMLVEHLDEKRPGGSWPTLALSLLVGSLVFYALLPYVPFLGDLLTSNTVVDTMPFMTLIVGAFLVAALLGSPILSRILSWRLLGLTGLISYSYYLIHAPFIMLIGHNVLRSRWVKPLVAQLDGAALWIAFLGYVAVMTVAVGVLSYLGYRYIESPFLRYKPK